MQNRGFSTLKKSMQRIPIPFPSRFRESSDKGNGLLFGDVPAGTVVSLSGIETEAWDGETGGSWNQDGLSGWLKTSRVLTPDEVYEWGYGTDYGCTEGWGDTLTVEKGKLYELIDVNEGGYFLTDGGFVFRGV